MKYKKTKLKDALNFEDVVICRCEEVTEGEILKAIKNGATTVDAVKKMTRAGMGNCQSRSCFQHIARLLSKETGKPLSEIKCITARPPVVPLPIKLFCANKGK